MEEQYRNQIIDVYSSNDTIIGGGLFVDLTTVITSAHVINDALGRNRNDYSWPREAVKCNFSLGEDKCEKPFYCFVKTWIFNNQNSRLSDMVHLEVAPTSEMEKLGKRENGQTIKICNDYWGHELRIYGYPVSVRGEWTGAKAYSQDADGLIVIESEKAITKGFSGFPVFDVKLNAFIGIIWGGRPERNQTAYIVPFKKLVEVNKAIPVTGLFRTGLGSMQNIVRRTNYHEKIDSALNKSSFCIVVGASGYGKSTICETYYREYLGGKKSFYQNLDTNRISLLGFDGLFYLDNYGSTNIMKDDIEASLECKILISCKSISEALDLLKRKGLYPWQDEIVVEVKGFSHEEARELTHLYGYEDELSDFEISNYIEATLGCPMALKGLLKLMQNGKLFSDFVFSNNSLDSEKAFFYILSEYINIKDPLARDVLAVLCNVPFIGMNASSLSKLLGTTKDDIENCLHDIVELGYILEYRKNKRFFKESLLVAHELLKKAFKKHFEETIDLKKQYREYNSKYFAHIASIPSDDIDVISKIDAFVCGIRGTFKIFWEHERFTLEEQKLVHSPNVTWEQYTPALQKKYTRQITEQDYFHAELSRVSSMAVQLFPSNTDDSLSNAIVEYFRGSIETADCSELIAIAQAFSRLPTNRLLGDTIWRGVTNYDDWAVACCIHSAVKHAKSNYEIINVHRSEQIKRWITNKTKAHEANDLDLCAAVSGLIYLGHEEWIIAELMSNSYSSRIGVTALSDLAVLVHCAATKKIDVLKTFFETVCCRISESQTKAMVLKYVKHKTGIDLSHSACQYQGVIFDDNFSLTIGRSLFNDDFSNYAVSNGCQKYSVV